MIARCAIPALLPFEEYDYIIVSFSGGKDSLVCLIHLLELGVDKSRFELWHQLVDGEAASEMGLMDWPVTESYCRAVATALDIHRYLGWLALACLIASFPYRPPRPMVSQDHE